MKFGLDVHGVIDTNPAFFAIYTKALVDAGHELHILTGPKRSVVEPYLKEHGIVFTHFFSIVESADPFKVRWEDKDNPWLDTEQWNRAKAKYCIENEIDLHVDDSDVYGTYFKTPYARFYSKDK